MKEFRKNEKSYVAKILKNIVLFLFIVVLVVGSSLGNIVYANEEENDMIAVDYIISYHREVRDVYVGDRISSLILPKEVTLIYGEESKSVYVTWKPEIPLNEFSSNGVFTKVGTVKYKMVLPKGYYIPEDNNLSSITEITVNIKENTEVEEKKYPYATVEDSMIKIYTSKYDSQLAYCYNQNLSRPSYDKEILYNEGVDYVGQDNKNENLIKSLIYIGYPFDGLGLRAKYNKTSDIEAYGETQSILWALLINSKPLFLTDYGNAVYEAVVNNQGVIPNRGEFSISETPKFTYVEDKDYYESQELHIIGYNGEVNLNLPDGVELYKKNIKSSSTIVSTQDVFTLRVSSDLVKINGKFVMSIDKYSYEYPEKIEYYTPRQLNEYGKEYQNLLSFKKVWNTLENERYFEVNVADDSIEEIEKPKPEETPDKGDSSDKVENPEQGESPDKEESSDNIENAGKEEAPDKGETYDKDDNSVHEGNSSSNHGPKTGDGSIFIYVVSAILSLTLLIKFRKGAAK